MTQIPSIFPQITIQVHQIKYFIIGMKWPLANWSEFSGLHGQFFSSLLIIFAGCSPLERCCAGLTTWSATQTEAFTSSSQAGVLWLLFSQSLGYNWKSFRSFSFIYWFCTQLRASKEEKKPQVCCIGSWRCFPPGNSSPPLTHVSLSCCRSQPCGGSVLPARSWSTIRAWSS